MSLELTVNEMENKIKSIIIEHLKLEKKAEDLDSNKDFLLESLGLNSIDALELLLKIEQEFNIEIDDEDLNVELVRSISSLCEYVSRKV